MSNDDTRSRLLDAAGPIFAEKGYQAATVREICQEAGVNLAAVNYYFGDKERLYVEAVKSAHPLSRAPKPADDWPPGTPPRTKLADFIHAAVHQLLGVHTAPWQSQLVLREVMNPTAACRELVEEYLRVRFNLLQSILDEILPPDTPAHKRHQIGFSIISQFVYFRAARSVIAMIVGEEESEEHYGAEQLADHITDVSLTALGLEP